MTNLCPLQRLTESSRQAQDLEDSNSEKEETVHFDDICDLMKL
jgi:hypothetical protein